MCRFTSSILWAVLIVLCLSTSTHAADKWLSVRSKNFLLVGNASESSIKRVARDLEEFRTALGNIFPRVNQESSIGTTVLVFKDDASFKPYKPLYDGKPSNVAGYFQPGEDVNFIALTADTQSPRVIYHEFVHSLTKDTALPVPPWVGEGLAEVYSMFEVSGKEILLGRAIGEHIALLNQQSMLPLNLLLSVGHGSPYYNERSKQGMFYAESWAAVHYLLFGNGGKRRPQFSKYLNLAANGKSVDENFRDAFETDYKTLEEEIRKYVSQVAWPAIKVKLIEKLDFDRDMQASAISEAQANYYVGDLLLHTNRQDVAETQLKKAIALDPKLSPAYASLGLMRVRQKKNEEALTFLTQAVEGDSRNHLAHFYYAQTLQQVQEPDSPEKRKAQLDLMRAHTLKAIDLAPRFIYAYSMLGYIALASREGVAQAEDFVRKGIEYAPGKMDLRLTLAQLMLVNNELPSAKALLTALKSVAGDDAISYQAERLLDNINNREAYERDLRAYQQSQREAALITTPTTISETGLDEPPRIVRKTGTATPTQSDDTVIETATPQMKLPDGIRIEGVLMSVDCTSGLTLRVVINSGTVELHTDTPAQLEFMSFTSTVKDSIACGTTEPPLRVAIVYKRTADHRFLGEPLRVDFIGTN